MRLREAVTIRLVSSSFRSALLETDLLKIVSFACCRSAQFGRCAGISAARKARTVVSDGIPGVSYTTDLILIARV